MLSCQGSKFAQYGSLGEACMVTINLTKNSRSSKETHNEWSNVSLYCIMSFQPDEENWR